VKRLDINITDRLDGILNELKRDTERTKTELVHDAVALLHWAMKVNEKDNRVCEVDTDTNQVIMCFEMPMFINARKPKEQSVDSKAL